MCDLKLERKLDLFLELKHFVNYHRHTGWELTPPTEGLSRRAFSPIWLETHSQLPSHPPALRHWADVTALIVWPSLGGDVNRSSPQAIGSTWIASTLFAPNHLCTSPSGLSLRNKDSRHREHAMDRAPQPKPWLGCFAATGAEIHHHRSAFRGLTGRLAAFLALF